MTLLMVVFAMALLASIGLVVDGGAKLRAVQDANRIAAEAARAATQQVDVATLQTGAAAALSTRAAVAAAQAVLDAAGAAGTVSPAPGGTIAVTASFTRPTIFLGLIGVPDVTGTGQATATLTIS